MLTSNHLLAGTAWWIYRTLVASSACLIFLVSPVGAQNEHDAQPLALAHDHATVRLTLLVGQAEVVQFLREPGTVILGDPAVAVVSLAASQMIVITALKSGETNLIVLDADGTEIDRLALRVVDRGDTVILRRGVEREVFRCYPRCYAAGEIGIGPAGLTPRRLNAWVESDSSSGTAEPLSK